MYSLHVHNIVYYMFIDGGQPCAMDGLLIYLRSNPEEGITVTNRTTHCFVRHLTVQREIQDVESHIASIQQRLVCSLNRRKDLIDSNLALSMRAMDAARVRLRLVEQPLHNRSDDRPRHRYSSVGKLVYGACQHDSVHEASLNVPYSNMSEHGHKDSSRPISSFQHTAALSYSRILASASFIHHVHHSSVPPMQNFYQASDSACTTSFNLGLEVDAYKAAAAAQLGCTPADICWFNELPIEVAEGLRLSFSTAMSSPECYASLCVAFMASTLCHHLFLTVCERGSEPRGHGAVQTTS
jgi:hypothetical protein